MKHKLLIALTVFTVLTFTQAIAQQTAKMSPKGTGFLQYLPDGYSSNTNKYSIVISLHGIKEKGNTLSDTEKVDNVGLPKYVKYGAKYNFILISPQLKTTMGRWTGDYVVEVLNYVKTYLRVDPSRIYLTGLSLGGGGVWSVSTAYPSIWAAILPICSGYNLASSAYKLANEDVPVWGFHGDADGVVGESVTINMINAINALKPSPLAKLTIFPGLGHVIWDKVYKETNALDWMLSYKKGTTSTPLPTTNATPVANAGSDKSLTLPSNATSLSGNATDSDGTIASYTWTKKSGSTASLSGTSSRTLNISNLVAGTYVFTLTAKDNDGASDTDEVTVTVKSNSTTNAAPVAIAGSDKTLTLPSNATSVYGNATDSDGTISSYTWTKKSGSTATLSGTSSKTLGLSNLVAGTYVFTLTARDNDGATDTDDVTVIVKSSTTSTTNKLPIANAGSNKLVVLPTTSIAVRATATDSDGTISSYSWSKVAGPGVSMSGNTTSTLKLSGLVAGTYTFRVTVKDNKGGTDTDDLNVVVDKAPVVNAGSDRTITLPYSSLTLTASATDSDGTIASYQWSKYSGPNIKMANSTSKTVTLSGFYSGTYVIKLMVKDNNGATSYDYVKITVNGSTASIEKMHDPQTELAQLFPEHDGQTKVSQKTDHISAEAITRKS